MTNASKKVKAKCAQATADYESLKGQVWELIGDDAPALIRTGDEMAKRFTERGNFNTLLAAVQHFKQSNIGDAYNTGVSSYLRIK